MGVDILPLHWILAVLRRCVINSIVWRMEEIGVYGTFQAMLVLVCWLLRLVPHGDDESTAVSF